ncbi:S28 family serine protease [Sorangium sp. So ce315]|uniref:S28 family serine protease n=1 Tax=Sorangium sp. So ce315 TaxID=3133299 RepID=UPI003F606E76
MRAPLLSWFAFTLSALAAVACGDDAGSGPSPGGTGGAAGAGAGGDAGGSGDTGGGGAGAGGDAGDSGDTGGGGAGGGAGGAGGDGGARELLEQLQAIEGLTVSEEESSFPGYRYFVMDLDQPADHGHPDGDRFRQRVVLHHRDLAAPVVLVTEGYQISPEYQSLEEPAELLAANQIRVEHRFFTPSRPASEDWSRLTIEQAAADVHRVIAAIRPLYEGRWISTGTSKGGMTSVYHRRFYPADVDGTVAYVAPHSAGISDPRYLDFVAERGDAACRQALQGFQREVLLRRPAMLDLMEAEAEELGLTYDHLGLERALEVAVVESVFSLWQYRDSSFCERVPTAASADDDVWAFLDEANQPYLWSDPYLSVYEPYHWQAAAELGYPGFAEDHLADLLVYPGANVPTSFVLPGAGKTPAFDPGAMQDVSAWLTAEGERFLFIYGENDPYTAAAFDLGAARDSHRFIAPGGTHGAVILALAPADQSLALDALAAWTGVRPARPAPSTLRPLLRGRRWMTRDSSKPDRLHLARTSHVSARHAEASSVEAHEAVEVRGR